MRKVVLDRISIINSFLNDYDSAMTVRQVFYQFVSKNLVPNNIQAYRRVQYAVKMGRLDGQIPWSSIVDTTRPEYKVDTWSSVSSFLNDVKSSFNLDYWSDSDNYVEVWTEKDALSGVIRPITDKFRVKLVVVRGYDSLSNLMRARHRFSGENNPVLIYVGDHDPSGLDIPRVLTDTLGDIVGVERVALTIDQIKKYTPPPQHVKREDPRSFRYSSITGLTDCWELDSLPPLVLRSVIEDAISDYVDFDIDELENDESSMIDEVVELIDKHKGGSGK